MKTLAERFWNKVEKTDEEDCWLWQGFVGRGGYGHFSPTTNVWVDAHRVAFELHNGFKPKVCRHTCDNPRCVNPAHLLNGTYADNYRDSVERGRACTGSRHPNSVLNEEKVVEIRQLHAEGNVTFNALGEIYGVSGSAISNAVRRLSWKHVI